MRRMLPTADQVLAVLAPVVGGGALLAAGGALLVGPLAGARRTSSLPDSWALAIDAALSLAFFVQHSGMVRRGFKAALARRVPERHLGAVYAIASGLVLAAVLAAWQRTAARLADPGTALRALGMAMSIAALAGFGWGVASLRRFDPFGLAPIAAHRRGRPERTAPLSVRGAYRWVRHPLYLCILLLLWAPLDLGLDRLLAAALWTAWIALGAVLEERDLVAELGEPYRAYQRAVPMLLPWRRPRPGGAG